MIVIALVLGRYVTVVPAQSVIQSTYTLPTPINQLDFSGAADQDGGFAVVARPVRPDTSDVFDLVLLHTGASGELLWATEYNIPGSQLARHIMRSVDGSGWVLVDDRPEEAPQHRGMLLHLDAYDQPLSAWAVVNPTNAEVTFWSMRQLAGGDLVVCGLIRELDLVTGTLLARITSAGQVLWARRIEGPALRLLSMALLADENIALAGSGTGLTTGAGISVMSISDSGDPLWAKSYANGVGAAANSIHHQAAQGTLLGCRNQLNDPARGMTIQMNGTGVPDRVRFYENEVLNGYSLADGSDILFLQQPGGVASMQRVSAGGLVPWVAGLGVSMGYPQLLAYAENSMYAFFTGDLDQRVSVTTFTAQCFTCNGEPGVADMPVAGVVSTDDLQYTISDFSFMLEPVVVTTSPLLISSEQSCRLVLEVAEETMEPTSCRWDASSRVLQATGNSIGRILGHRVVDATGREVSADWRSAFDPGTATIVLRPTKEMYAGIYVAQMRTTSGEATCRFAVVDF